MEILLYLFATVFGMYALYRIGRLGCIYIAKLFDGLEK